MTNNDLISPFGTDSLDLENIRDIFKEYLKDNDVIKDVNYLGSTISILIDLISYAIKNLNSTHALLSNETILKLSTTRQNIVFLAAQLGYKITRRISAKMPVNISYDILPTSGLSLTIPRGTKFKCGEYYFLVDNDILLNESQYTVPVKLKQGVYVDGEIDGSLKRTIEKPTESITLNYQYIENDSIGVRVKTACENGDYVNYQSVPSLASLGKNKYYEEYDPTTGYVKLYFYFSGYGKILSEGDQLDITFIISDGNNANGISSCKIADKIYDSQGNEAIPNIDVISSSYGGQDEESDESLKNNAPLFYNSANRTAVESDYKSYLEKTSLIRTGVAWGGELMNPMVLGQIFISALPQDEKSDYLTDLEIAEVINLLADVRIVSTFRKFFQPVYFDIDSRINILGDIQHILEKQNLIKSNLEEYFKNDVHNFNSIFYEAKTIRTIENVFVEDTASVNVEFDITFELTQKHFEYNMDVNNKCVIFIPNSSKRYYLKKGDDRIDVPNNDTDLYSYYINGWTKVYEANEDIDITFEYGNELTTGDIYNDGEIDKKDILWNGVVMGYFDVTDSILYLDSDFKNNFADSIRIKVLFSPYFNAAFKHNSIARFGDISYV